MGGPAPTIWILWKTVQNCDLYRAFTRCVHIHSIFVASSIDTFDSIKRQEQHKSRNLFVHTYSAFLQLILFDKLKLAFILVIATLKRVISSIYTRIWSHMIRRMSFLPLIKTNKPETLNVSINKHRQKELFDKNWATAFSYSIFVVQRSQMMLIDKNRVSVNAALYMHLYILWHFLCWLFHVSFYIFTPHLSHT